MPLTGLNVRDIPNDKMQRLRNKFGDGVWLAKDLLRYDPRFQRAIDHVFGSTIICADSNIAKQVTFNREFGLKAINLQGDLYNPAGTLSGGHSNESRNFILKLFQFE